MEIFADKTTGEVFSFFTSLALTLFAFWGLVAFWPKKHVRNDSAAGWLIIAIWIGFLGNGLNALYWRVYGDIALHYGWIDIDQLRYVGNSFGDIIWKGCAALSIYLHFFARWKALPEEDKPYWTPLLTGFYPDTKHWIYIIHKKLRLVNNKKTQED